MPPTCRPDGAEVHRWPGVAEPDDLRVGRRWHPAAPRRRAVQDARRGRSDPCHRGATAAIPDLLAGRIRMFIGAINSLLPLINEGKLTALASTGASASPRCRMCRPWPKPSRLRDHPGVGLVAAPARRPRSSDAARDAGSSPRRASISAWPRSVDVLGTAGLHESSPTTTTSGARWSRPPTSGGGGVMKTLKAGIASGDRARMKQPPLTFVLLAAIIADASAQSYPDRAIKVIVPPGRRADRHLARAVHLAELGQSVVIENQSGRRPGRDDQSRVARLTAHAVARRYQQQRHHASALQGSRLRCGEGFRAGSGDHDIRSCWWCTPTCRPRRSPSWSPMPRPTRASSARAAASTSPHFLLSRISGANILFVPYRGAAPAAMTSSLIDSNA